MRGLRMLWFKAKGQAARAREDESLEAEIYEHIALLKERYQAQGMSPSDAERAARRQFGNVTALKERHRALRGFLSPVVWWRDLQFGIRMLAKRPTSSVAAILTLALSMGGCLAVFRLVDALLVRPLPVANPERLFTLSYPYMNSAGQIESANAFDYPQFKKLRSAVSGDAELIAVSPPSLTEVTFGTDEQMERMRVQFVSGWTFDSFGLKPAIGRLLEAADDATPGENAVAVISWNTWNRRFGCDPQIVGRKFRLRDTSYEIVGVAKKGFAGTDPGWGTDIFVPTMMNARLIDQPNLVWFNIFVHLNPGASPAIVRQKLKAAERIDRLERVKSQHWPTERYQYYIASELLLEPAASGYSGLQRQYGRSLLILAMIVALVLVIANVNVANLMIARAQSRAREMALRIAIGAGRARLIQLVIVESALIGVLACALGALFAAWAAPFIVRQISTSGAPPITISLAYDWRVSIFSVVLVLFAIISMGSIPAFRASGIKPVAALRGGHPLRQRNYMNILVGAQIGFCVLVLFVAGLFVSSLWHLTTQPLGFDSDRLINLAVTTSKNVSLTDWEQVRQELQNTPGVSSVAISTWPLLLGPIWSEGISVSGRPALSQEADFLATSPEWLQTVRIPLIEGRELRGGDPYPGPVLVNQAFAKQYFNGQDPIGRSFQTRVSGKAIDCTIVGVIGDARYSDIRQLPPPTVYVAFSSPQPIEDGTGNLVIRTNIADPNSLTNVLRQRASEIRHSFRVTDVYLQTALIDQQTVRERLLAAMSSFFAAVGIVLSVIGLYGVLNYSVLQRWHEIGIRRALGAPRSVLVWSIMSGTVVMLVPGAFLGLTSGIACQRYFSTLLFQTSTYDLWIIGFSLIVSIAITLVAALPAITRALLIDPSAILRSE